HYRHVDVALDGPARTATITVSAPRAQEPTDLAGIHDRGASWWPLTMARELDDAVLMLRANHADIGTWLLRTRGSVERILTLDEALVRHGSDWFVREVVGMLRRTFARLEVSSRTLFAILDNGSCFAGTLFELALAADRAYMRDAPEEPDAPRLALSPSNFGCYPTVAHSDRLSARFYGEATPLANVRAAVGRSLDAREALELGLVTAAPDALDWDDEIRVAVEERTSLSPDALTGMEASLRFGTAETMETRIFGRLSAWQNWIFSRPNAVGEAGALKVFGTGSKAGFDWQRV
ncbi:MAG TPA: benzoyl-CoA-dihydrodiol lyase, partial [Gammaproteobacteria bacterium]|nr:benzoyl-CoA-dihydrodiol lyase [Gammaproteobacteria bacterium]